MDELIPNGIKKASGLDEITDDVDVIITMLPNGKLLKVYENLIVSLKQILY